MERRQRTLLVATLLSIATILALVTLWLVYDNYSEKRERLEAAAPAEQATGAAAKPEP